MKKRSLLPVLIALCAIPLHAQAIKPSDLPPADQEKYKAAQKAARAADPTIKQKSDDAKAAARAGMLKADPSIAPILDKVMPVSGTAAKLSELPQADQEKYKAAQKAARAADPTIKQKSDDAKAAARAGMLKADPSIAPILDKVMPVSGN